jgi:hypothetical protein
MIAFTRRLIRRSRLPLQNERIDYYIQGASFHIHEIVPS